ncbi:DUF805 domain-containing protein [Actinoplanes sp. NBRC 103695]|uniref:DUF805 domain-containing protein n=1 Tax=Actinoplanes sp. NBRC 103695 TaxID=3032202 RepID=UPI0024A013C4|nr:DUF805 domain-containing protein [Actinoplanes sp. NBRC 103695]GLY94176.1 membrane protein [Actinoplanes sp. NBRC 103695]
MTVASAPSVGPLGYWLGCFRKYATFEGRARRAEYWWFTLLNVLLYAIVLAVGFGLDSATGGEGVIPGVLIVLYVLAVFLPSLAVTVRRLHDAGNTGWFYLLSLIPFVGGIILLVLTLQAGNPGPNQYGPDPRQI